MSNETRRILLVEDEKAIRDAVAGFLERDNYWVTAVGDGQEALEEFGRHHFDLVVLDLMLPRVPGENVCRAIRDNSDVPIIMLTAKGDVGDRIIGLELGADDYLVKPFSPRELVARVRALLRRAHVDSEPQREVLEFGELTIDVSGHKVLVNGEEVDLTASEFKLLTTLSMCIRAWSLWRRSSAMTSRAMSAPSTLTLRTCAPRSATTLAIRNGCTQFTASDIASKIPRSSRDNSILELGTARPGSLGRALFDDAAYREEVASAPWCLRPRNPAKSIRARSRAFVTESSSVRTQRVSRAHSRSWP